MKKLAVLICMLLLLGKDALALESTQWIKVPEDFAAEEWAGGLYATQYVRGESVIDLPSLAQSLLGADYIEKDDGTLTEAKDGEVWEIKRLGFDAAAGEISYWDPMVSSERGAEYEPPVLGVSREEALAMCRELLGKHMPDTYFARLNAGYEEQDRWNNEEKLRMDDAQYDAFCRERQLAYFCFDQAADNGLAILDTGLRASVGVNGLNGFELRWNAFTASGGETELMPLQQALEMADTTRSAETTLLYAEPVYSNRVSGDAHFNLSWYIVTSKGNYVVDCVAQKHVCDRWEY